MPTVLREDFNTNDGGWGANADAAGFTYVPVAGDDGGYISATDSVGGATWYFTSGPAFEGDLSIFVGGSLSYTIRQANTNSQYDDIEVLIVGASRTIGFDLPIDQHPGLDWTPYDIALTASAGWFDVADNTPVSDAEFAAVLADVQDLQIRGEYRIGGDTAQLDDVILTSVDDGTGGTGGGSGGGAPNPLSRRLCHQRRWLAHHRRRAGRDVGGHGRQDQRLSSGQRPALRRCLVLQDTGGIRR